jgi:hypothetical protein
MRARPRAGRAAAAAVGLLALGGMMIAAAPAATAAGHLSSGQHGTVRAAALRPACPAAAAGHMRCFVMVPGQRAAAMSITAAAHKTRPKGWGAKALERAYRLPVWRNEHQTIAVSIAGNTPHLAQYLKVYREHYGLPPCGTASGCLRIVNENGKAKPPAPSSLFSGWDVEATLDVSMISAACPLCHIVVVEARSTSDGDLGKTDSTAARLGAQVISNSYGQRENGQAMNYRKDYRHPGHMVVVSAGDYGFDAANFPADLASVTAVGGTELASAHNARGYTERVWYDPSIFGAGASGCSAYVGKPAWQHDKHCPGRTVADVSAIAANVPIFNAAWGGWITVAGTSAAAPFISGVYGLAGNASRISPRYLYQHRADFFDITKGSNALFGGSAKQACGDDYLCTAKRGYDAPTGVGTPDGTGGL